MNSNNYCIIMAGGFGNRLWPVSRPGNPKQFQDMLRRGESMLQGTFRRFAEICPRENIVIVTGESLAPRVFEQIPGLKPYQVLVEPFRRNTAPCVAYAASVIESMCPDANVIVSPADHAIFGEHRFAQDMRQALSVTEREECIVTVGVRPTNPNTKYGYIQFAEEPAFEDAAQLHRVVTFTEKPPLEMACQFIETGEFFWNAGIFVWSLPVLRKAYQQHLPDMYKDFSGITFETPAEQINRIYSQTESISVDFGIMEKAANVYVLEASFGWSDVESWDSLYNTYRHDENGNAVISGTLFAYETHDTVVHLLGGKTVVLQGLDGYVVAGDEDMLLICRRDQEGRLVKFVSDVEIQKLSQKTNK